MKMKRKKTGKSISVSILPVAQKIIKKYEDEVKKKKYYQENKCPFQCLVKGKSGPVRA